jgi:putative FmdB family regulatory protein
MPIYEYRCQHCSLTFEVKRSFENGAKVVCPKCEREVKQKYYPAPIFFKGGGFSTTYRG